MNHAPQHEEMVSEPAIDETPEETKPPFCSRVHRFLHDPVRSKIVLPAFAVTVLLSISIGLTVGIVPEVLTDRYARLYHGYGSQLDEQGALPCWVYQKSEMPESCIRGADDAQTGSAWGMFLQNMLTFFFNASIGSYSDVHGRRSLLIVSVFLNMLVPGALLAMQLIETLDPFWYYATNAATGMISINALIFAALSDDCPEEYRAGRFATNLAGFYAGFSTAPTLALWMTHSWAMWWSFVLLIVALFFAIYFLPETLPEIVATRNVVTVMGIADASLEEPLLTLDGGHEDNTSTEGTLEPAECDDDQESCLQKLCNIVLQPLREMTILNRNGVMRLLALGSFLAAAVYSTDASLVLFYIEEHLNVREDDIASMFFIMGLLGALLQGIGLQPLVYALGENGLLILSFISGTIHNFLYGVARNKTCITAALSLSQLTKLSYPLLSSLSSQQVGMDEQGQLQGALLALNALAGAVGPVSMNWIYQQTESSDKYFGPGTMFLFASLLYFMGAGVVSLIPANEIVSTDTSEQYQNSACVANSSTQTDEARDKIIESSVWENGDLEEPLLDLRQSMTI